MTHPASLVRRMWWLIGVCLLILPPLAAAADAPLTADLDGDGLGDRVLLTRQDPTVVRIWLSASSTTQVIRARAPLECVIAADLDGDHRPELIAHGGRSGLTVWTRRQNRFETYTPRHAAPVALGEPRDRGLDDRQSDPCDDVTAADGLPLALILSPEARAPAAVAGHAPAAPAPRLDDTASPFDRLLPRPPPSSASL